jgi:hypothetical protein
VFNRDVNIFLGDNAAGKTTILRCLGLAAIGLAAANEVEQKAEAYLRKGARRGAIEVLFELIPDPDSQPTESGYFVVGLQITAESSRFTSIPNTELLLRRPDQTSEPPSNSAEFLGALRSDRSSRFGFVSGYGPVRTFGESKSSTNTELTGRENEWVCSLFEPGAWLVHPDVLAKLIRGDTSTFDDAPLGGLPAELIHTVRTSLKRLCPEVTTFVSEGDNDIQLNGIPLRFGELSEGYRSLLALMGHLLRCSLRFLNWKDDPTRIEGIALIDEIDLHLHPTWQNHVVRDFRRAFCNTQLIASTHSPLVLGELKRENVKILRREEDGRITLGSPEIDPQGLGVVGILTNIFDLSSTIDQPTLDKITERLLLYSKRESWTREQEHKYSELTDELARLGFSREYSDPYFERFAIAMAKRHRAALENLTPRERLEVDAYADELLTDITADDGQ